MLSDDDDITLTDDPSSFDELYDQLDHLGHSYDDWHQRQIEDDEARAAHGELLAPKDGELPKVKSLSNWPCRI